MAILKNSFFNREADIVAEDLIGCFLCTKKGRYEITETEAYMGPDDLASHASGGRTKRNEAMYGNPGTIYIYLVYGMYNMLNIVTGEKDYPAAVLIRGAGEYDGPGKLTRGLGITRGLNGSKLGERIWIEEKKEKPKEIKRTPRIGVSYAGKWKNRKLRFITGTTD
jgi:DNA-3-methyladenine glycosylase